jgi:glycolate oxidase iron-sulfur subunit
VRSGGSAPPGGFGEPAARCVKCGTCMTECPVFALVRKEGHSPRGKLALIEAASQGALAESGAYRRCIETCLLCGACQDACPNGVRTAEAFLRAREHLARERGIAPGRSFVLRHLLRAARSFRLAMKTGWAFQQLAFSHLPADSGLRRRIPLPMIPSERLVPALSRYSFTEVFDGLVREGDGPRVGIFAGCMINYLYPGIGEGVVRILGMLDATVVVPPGQGCCGMPALAGGARATVVELARRNLEAFEGHRLEAIVTGCASCGENIKSNYRALLAESGVSHERAEAFVSRLQDAGEFFSRMGIGGYMRRDDRRGGKVTPVTYHHPCHLGRLQGVRSEPIELLRSLPGVTFVPMADAERCCGMGGSFSLDHYDLAKGINDAKVRAIRDSGVPVVVTSCPACILHIRDGLRRHGVRGVEVVHLAEFIARSLSSEGRDRAVEPAEEGWEEPVFSDHHEGI